MTNIGNSYAQTYREGKEGQFMEVNPEKQNIHTLFSTTNFYIDFYQREYKWKDKTVLQLIGMPKKQ